MDATTPIAKGRERGAVGLFHSNQVAAFDYSERQAAFSARFMNCLTRAFDAIGASSASQEVIFSSLQMSRNLARNEIVDKPSEFIEGLKAIYGDAGVVVFEYMMTKEMKREFRLTAAFDREPTKPRGLANLLQLAYSVVESPGNP